MKVFIRTVHINDSDMRERVRDRLNADGFYVLRGVDAALHVYAIEYQIPLIESLQLVYKRVTRFLLTRLCLGTKLK